MDYLKQQPLKQQVENLEVWTKHSIPWPPLPPISPKKILDFPHPVTATVPGPLWLGSQDGRSQPKLPRGRNLALRVQNVSTVDSKDPKIKDRPVHNFEQKLGRWNQVQGVLHYIPSG